VKTTFFRLVASSSKAKELRALCREQDSNLTFRVERSAFSAVPTSPFCYWIGDSLRGIFKEFPQFDEHEGNTAKVGLQTSDDNRFVRLWWEVAPVRIGQRWFQFSRGEADDNYYGDVSYLVGYSRADQVGLMSIGRFGRGADQYFKPGITWTLRASRMSPRAVPAGCIFSNRGQTAFSDGGMLAMLAILNTSVVDFLFKVSLGRFGYPEFLVGVLLRLPYPIISEEKELELSRLAKEIWLIKYHLDRPTEGSHAFTLPRSLLLSKKQADFEVSDWGDLAHKSDRAVASLQAQIDALGFAIYQIGTKDRETISATLSIEAEEPTGDHEDREDHEVGDTGAVVRSLEYELTSWSVGVAFGRFDFRLATGERPIPTEPEPFDPLPAKSPGMLPDGVAPFMPTTGVFIDDPGHADDLATRIAAVHGRVGETPPAPDALRRTLAKDFFPAHIRMYSKSRRKAPIYWQLATPSTSYSVWLYIHAFGKDTLFRVQNDYVAPKLAHERRELEGLLAEAGPSPTTAQSRSIEAQSTFVEELSALLDEVKRVAPLWDPDLDDGVILNFAPLWRLVPQNRAWQKELRAAWASLVAGDYDWARLPMRLWPERVVLKCAKDRSLAIAHDLEDVFWFEDAAGKWQARPTPTRQLADLIAERTSPAVKAALQSLLDAPEPVAASGRGRGKRS